MKNGNLLVAAAVSALICFGGVLIRAQSVSLVSASVGSAFGYDSNRTRDAAETSSAFVELSPDLKYMLLFPGASELDLYATYLHREFLASGLSSEEELDVGARLFLLSGRTHAAARLSTGLFRNRDDAWDDHTWVSFMPAVWREFAGPWEWKLRGIAAYEAYDSRTTLDGEDEEALYGSVAAGLGRRIGLRAFAWAEAIADRYAPGERLDEYSEQGMRAATEWDSGRRLKLGLELGGVSRKYEAWPARQTRLDGQLWVKYRVVYWADVLASVEGLACDGSGGADDYDRWIAKTGLQLVAERDVP